LIKKWKNIPNLGISTKEKCFNNIVCITFLILLIAGRLILFVKASEEDQFPKMLNFEHIQNHSIFNVICQIPELNFEPNSQTDQYLNIVYLIEGESSPEGMKSEVSSTVLKNLNFQSSSILNQKNKLSKESNERKPKNGDHHDDQKLVSDGRLDDDVKEGEKRSLQKIDIESIAHLLSDDDQSPMKKKRQRKVSFDDSSFSNNMVNHHPSTPPLSTSFSKNKKPKLKHNLIDDLKIEKEGSKIVVEDHQKEENKEELKEEKEDDDIIGENTYQFLCGIFSPTKILKKKTKKNQKDEMTSSDKLVNSSSSLFQSIIQTSSSSSSPPPPPQLSSNSNNHQQDQEKGDETMIRNQFQFSPSSSFSINEIIHHDLKQQRKGCKKEEVEGGRKGSSLKMTSKRKRKKRITPTLVLKNKKISNF